MSGFNLRHKPRVSYCEIEEPNLDEYMFCEECADFVYEYCSIHGPLLVIPDDKVAAGAPARVPRAALTVPRVFLHLAPSVIPGAGLGVFSTLTLPRGVRFGPYRGKRTQHRDSKYGWQLHDGNNKWSHLIDASDADASNWMRYVNCARHWCEQNLLAYQYQGNIYYRTIKIIPRFTELMVFYGSEFANLLGIDLKHYNSPPRFIQASCESEKSKNHTIEKTKANTQKVDKSNNIKKDRKKAKISKKTRNITKKKGKGTVSKEILKAIPRPKSENRDSVTRTTKKLDNTEIKLKDIFLCETCNRTFICKDEHISHLKEHTLLTDNNTLQKNKSLIDNTSVESNMKVHLQRNNIEVKLSYRKSLLNTRIETHPGEKPFKCDYCNKCFIEKSNLTKHIRTHTGEKPFKCEYCNKCFNVKTNLTIHIRTHTGEKPYKCEYCNKCFIEKSNLTKHIRTHTGEKPFKCEYCNKCFNVKTNLTIHIRTHTGEKPYKCEYCNKCFIEKSNLTKHIRTHTGEKPFKCEYCYKCFNVKTNLTIHIRTHTGEKPYKCEYCNKRFIQKNSLSYHIKTHTGEKPFKCDYCNKCFNVKSYLTKHIRTHTGEKPFKCEYCNKCFNVKSNLTKHIRTHTGEKPFKCDYCNKCFTQKSSIKIHIRTHTGSLKRGIC